MDNPKISVCRRKMGVDVGCYDKFDCIRDFIFYINEEQGIEEAKAFFKSKGVVDAKIVRPKITKMTKTYRRK